MIFTGNSILWYNFEQNLLRLLKVYLFLLGKSKTISLITFSMHIWSESTNNYQGGIVVLTLEVIVQESFQRRREK